MNITRGLHCPYCFGMRCATYRVRELPLLTETDDEPETYIYQKVDHNKCMDCDKKWKAFSKE